MGLLDALGLEAPRSRQKAGSGGSDVAPVGAQSKVFTDYAVERAAVKQLVDALKAHPQASKITTQLAAIAAKLDSATQNALKAQWPAAMKDLQDARAACVAAKKRADDWQAYLKKRANVLAQSTAHAGLDDDLAAAIKAEVDAADAKANANPPRFDQANAVLDNAYAAVKPRFQGKIDALKAMLAKVEGMGAAVKKYLAGPIAEGKALTTQAAAALASEDWSQALINWSTGWDVIAPLERYGQRRLAYETQRTTTVADIAAIKAMPATASRGAALDAMLAIADDLATLEKLKLEEGVKTLQAISARCAALKIAGPVMASYQSQRSACDSELATLEKHPAAGAQLAAPLAAIRQQLATAKSAADQADANPIDPRAWAETALTAAMRARADLATAKKLADSLGASVGAQAAAAGQDVGAMKKALAALKADIATAAGAPFADVAKKSLERAKSQAADAEKALAKDDAKTGGAALAAAATALAEGRTLQAVHAEFASTLPTVEARVKALQALPTAKSIAARIDPVATALDAAKKADKNGDGQAAMAALRQAIDMAALADAADRDRRAFDAESARVRARVQGEVADANLKKTLSRNVDEDAKKLADAFRFGEAGGALKRVEVEIGKAKLKAGMSRRPPDSNLKSIAAEMVAKGGASEVDDAIQASPDKPTAIVIALAEGRFGKPFKFEGDDADADADEERMKAMKAICAMFAKIPEDLTRNPSIKDVSHADAVGSAGGGYTSSSAHIGMNGRVGIQQDFGSDETNYDPKTNKDVKALPDNIDEDSKPKPGQIEYLGFAAAHEVGHGVDDKRGFMAKNGEQAKYGGWITYGSSVQPIANAVGADIAGKFPTSSFYKTTASKQYVLDKIMSKPAERPSAAIGSEDYKALDAFDLWHALATASDVYRRQSDCDAITIGDRIYHEAYPRQWVSYLAAARKKGLTGYQFRSPAEWFAEVYACWKSDKLGPKHPALEWLTKL